MAFCPDGRGLRPGTRTPVTRTCCRTDADSSVCAPRKPDEQAGGIGVPRCRGACETRAGKGLALAHTGTCVRCRPIGHQPHAVADGAGGAPVVDGADRSHPVHTPLPGTLISGAPGKGAGGSH